MDKRFSRFEAMIGAEQMEALRHSHVMVVGVGGVGGGTVEALSRAGVGTLTLVDRDAVDITNMNRQVAALSSTVGIPKVEALAARVRDVNPECDVRPLCVNLAADTVDELLSDRPDCVADCIDDMNAKVLLICECKRRGIPIVSSMGAGNRLDPSKLSITDVFRRERSRRKNHAQAFARRGDQKSLRLRQQRTAEKMPRRDVAGSVFPCKRAVRAAGRGNDHRIADRALFVRRRGNPNLIWNGENGRFQTYAEIFVFFGETVLYYCHRTIVRSCVL